jgi:pimeloyl-ACP methyl ester carboxylesterase
VPVRLSYGDQSLPAFRDVVHRIATDVPSATVVGLGATGHVPQVTHPQLMTESLLAWLRAGADCHTGLTQRTTAMTALDTAVAQVRGIETPTLVYTGDRDELDPHVASSWSRRPRAGGPPERVRAHASLRRSRRGCRLLGASSHRSSLIGIVTQALGRRRQ